MNTKSRKRAGHLKSTSAHIRSISLSITQDVINRSMRGTHLKCLLAIAVRDYLRAEIAAAGGGGEGDGGGGGGKKRQTMISVTAERVSFTRGGWRYSYDLPAGVALRVKEWDEGARIEPFKFQLDGRYCSIRPVTVHPNRATKYKKETKPRAKPTARKCVHRFAGVRVLEVPSRSMTISPI